MTKLEYFIEVLSESLKENQVYATAGDIKSIAEDIVNSVENMDQAFPVPDFNPYREENERLSNQLKKEMSKINCLSCNGRGTITIHGPIHSGTSSCFKCNGEGKHLP